MGEKGYLDVHIEVKSPGGHSSVPPAHTVSGCCHPKIHLLTVGSQSIGMLSQIIVALENDPYPVRLNRSSPMYNLLQCEAAYAPPEALAPRFRNAVRRSLISDRALEFVTEVMSMNSVWRAFVGTTQATDVIHGGVKANALPEQATVLINHRITIERRVQCTYHVSLVLMLFQLH